MICGADYCRLLEILLRRPPIQYQAQTFITRNHDTTRWADLSTHKQTKEYQRLVLHRFVTIPVPDSLSFSPLPISESNHASVLAILRVERYRVGWGTSE